MSTAPTHSTAWRGGQNFNELDDPHAVAKNPSPNEKLRICPGCKQAKREDDFPLDRARKSGRMCRCRECDNARSRDYYYRNLEARRTKARNYARTAKKRSPQRKCERCGAPAVSQRHHYCHACREWAEDRRSKRYWGLTAAQRERKRERDRVRRKAPDDPRRKGAWQKVRARVLRSATHCAICHWPLDFSAKPRSRWSPSVDHIIPVSQGGEPYALDNLRAAHYGCNAARCNRIAVERPAGMRPFMRSKFDWY